MSQTAPSRAQLQSPTLADVIVAINRSTLPRPQKHDQASAVRSAARALGRSPEELPADVRLLAKRLAEVAPHALGLSPGRWKNIRSLLRAALESVTPVAPGRHLTPLSLSWQTLWDQLGSRWMKTGLSRFLHFCSAAAIEPEDVDEETFASFRHHLDSTLLKDPAVVYRRTLATWNRARTSVTDWPDIAVAASARRKTWTLGWEAFPESLHGEVRNWLDRLAGNDPLEELSVRPLRPLTLKSHEYAVRQFASAVALQRGQPESLRSLSDLVALDTFKAGLRFMLDRHGRKSPSVVKVAITLKAIARHYVHADEQHLEKLKAIIRKIDPQQRGLTCKNRARLRPFEDSATVRAFLQLPKKLMDLAERERQPFRAARLAQTAVAIEILLMTGMRISNLANLDVERHLIRPSPMRPALHIVIAGEEVKNGEPLEYPIQPQSLQMIERYLTRYRRILMYKKKTTALFPGANGQAKSINALREQVVGAVHTYTGLKVHPHLFRHIAAKIYLDLNPGSQEVVRRLLGHRSINTTTAFYTGLETAAAVRHFDQTIVRLREMREQP